MNEDGHTPPGTLLCGRCEAPYDAEDNFCRQCGLPLHDAQLPAVRDDSQAPAVWRPSLPALVVRGAAAVAVGAMVELVVRRLVSGTLGRATRTTRAPAPAPRKPKDGVPRDEPLPEDTQMVSETLLLRRIRFRR